MFQWYSAIRLDYSNPYKLLKDAMDVIEIVECASMSFCKGVLCGKDVGTFKEVSGKV